MERGIINMQTLTKEEMKVSLKKALREWIDPEETGGGKILSFDTSLDGYRAFALVLYPDSAIEINYIFYTGFSLESSLSCEKRFHFSSDYDRSDEAYQNHVKEQNELLVQTVTDVYQAMVKRMQ